MCLKLSYLSCESSQQALLVFHCEEEMEHRQISFPFPSDCVCGCLLVQCLACVYISYLSSLGAPAARPALINQMPYWGSSVVGFTSMGPWVITKHHHPRAWASPLHHRRVSQPSSSIRSHLWDDSHNSSNCWHDNEWVFNGTERRKTLGNVGIIRVGY